MPITTTEKIWMDGELVDWADATVHVLTHTMHYGSGVFEGIRAYPTSRGVAVFRLGTTSAGCSLGQDLHHRRPLHGGRGHRGVTRRRAGQRAERWLLPPPLVYLGYGEMGLNPLPCPVNVSVAAWPWGTYLG